MFHRLPVVPFSSEMEGQVHRRSWPYRRLRQKTHRCIEKASYCGRPEYITTHKGHHKCRFSHLLEPNTESTGLNIQGFVKTPDIRIGGIRTDERVVATKTTLSTKVRVPTMIPGANSLWLILCSPIILVLEAKRNSCPSNQAYQEAVEQITPAIRGQCTNWDILLWILPESEQKAVLCSAICSIFHWAHRVHGCFYTDKQSTMLDPQQLIDCIEDARHIDTQRKVVKLCK